MKKGIGLHEKGDYFIWKKGLAHASILSKEE
jgi:hypothetical protein